MLQAIANYFINNPMDIYYLIGGSGGIYFWINQWRSRIRVEVKILSESYDIQNDFTRVNIKAEFVNIGDSVTSIKPNMQLVALSPTKQKVKCEFQVISADRTIQSHDPKIIEFTCKCNHSYPFTCFRHYKFKFTKGQKSHSYIYSANNKELNVFQHHWGRFQFCLLNKLPA